MADPTPSENPTETPSAEPVAFNASTATDAELRAEFNRVAARGQELSASEEPGAAAELLELSAALPTLQAELASRESAAQAVQAAKDVFSSVTPLAEPAPVAPAEPVVAPQAEPVAPAAPVHRVSQLAAQARPEPTKAEPKGDRITVQLSADAAGVLGHQAGTPTTVRQIGEASARLFGQFGTSRVGGGIKAERALATFSRDRGAELTLTGDRDRKSTRLNSSHLVISYAVSCLRKKIR